MALQVIIKMYIHAMCDMPSPGRLCIGQMWPSLQRGHLSIITDERFS